MARRLRLRRRRRPVTLRAALPGLRRTVRHFGPVIRKQRAPIATGVLAMVGEVAFRLLEPWPLALVLDHVIQSDDAPVSTGMGPVDGMAPGTLLLVAAAGVVVLTGMRALASYVSTISFAIAGNRILTDVRANVYAHLLRLSLSFHSRARGGDLLTRVTGDIGRLKEVAVTAALPLAVNALNLVGMIAVMLWLDWRLTGLALSVMPLFWLTAVRLTSRIRTVSRKQRRREGAIAAIAAESVSAIKVVQAYSLEPVFEDRFGGENRSSLRDGVQAKRLAAGLERRTDALIALGTGLVLYFGARLVLSGALSPGGLIVFIAYLKNTFKPMRDVAKFTGRLAKASASGERVVDILETVEEVRDAPGAVEAPRLTGEVRFDGVNLSYDGRDKILTDVSLDVSPGETIALVGPSGAGKSSIVGLLLRFYDADSGTVSVDGIDVRDLTLASLRRQIAIVLQDAVLFHGTIRDNIAVGRPGCTEADVVAAAELANAHGFVSSLPRGYDTPVSERGVTLSGGERQRIAIARAALRDAPILVLDEPTTGLDRENEQAVLDALRRLRVGRTTFLIAHDLSTVVDADRIVYVEAGAIHETGSHTDLLAAAGPYAAMFDLHRRVTSIETRQAPHATGRRRRATR